MWSGMFWFQCGDLSNKVVMVETWLRGTLTPALGCDGWKAARAGLQRQVKEHAKH